MTSTASWPPRAPLQVDFIAAHGGTPTGLGEALGDGLGSGEADGVGLASGVGDSDATREGEALGSAAVVGPPHAAASKSAATAVSWSFTAV